MRYPSNLLKELSELWCKHILACIRPDEQTRMYRLLKEYRLSEPDTNEIVERLKQEEEFDYSQAYQQFLNRRKKRAKQIKWWYYTAATVFLLLSIYWITKNYIEAPLPIETTIIHAGSCKAVITLANGEKISLNEKIRHIKETDGTLFVSDSGHLNYNTDNISIEKNQYHRIEVPRGAEFSLTLSDGTEVWLNSESELYFPIKFPQNQREVSIKGEAYFRASRQNGAPFIVKTSRGKLQVTGTEFNVRDYRNEHKLVATLVSGSISYSYNDKNIMIPVSHQLTDSLGHIQGPYRVNTIRYMGWKEGKYIFENCTLENIMRTLEKWYDISVVYTVPQIKQLHFTGDMERFDTINTFLEFIELGGDVRFTIQGQTVTVSPKHL